MFVRRVTVTMKSTGPVSASKLIEDEKKGKEGHEEFEKRCWKSRCHFDQQGIWYIPAIAFKNAIESASRYESIKIKGNESYTKVIMSGVMPDMSGDPQGISLGIHRDDVVGEWLFVPGQPKPGKKGVGTRVRKCFPLCREWKGEVSFYVLDERLTSEVFERIMHNAGMFVGVGRWRAENGGLYGRFLIESIEWQDVDASSA